MHGTRDRLPIPLPGMRAESAKIDGQDIGYLQMDLNVSTLLGAGGLAAALQLCPGSVGATLQLGQSAASDATLTLKTYFNVTKDTTFAYGANNNITVTPGALKFSLEATNWCALFMMQHTAQIAGGSHNCS